MSSSAVDIIKKYIGLNLDTQSQHDKDPNDKRFDLDVFDKLSETDLNKYGIKSLGLEHDYFDKKLLADDGSGQKFRELEFFVRNDGNTDGTFYDHISKYCHTNVGKLYLKKKLIEVTTKSNNNYDFDFEYTQNSVRKILDILKNDIKQSEKGVTPGLIDLHHDPKLPGYDMKMGPYTLDETLSKISRYEPEVLSLYQPDGDEINHIIETIYFNNKTLQFMNYQERVMNAYYIIAMYISPVYFIIAPMLAIMAPYIMLKYVLGLNIRFDDYWSLTKSMFTKATGITKMLETGLSRINYQISRDETVNKFSLTFRMGIKFVMLLMSMMNSTMGQYSYLLFIFVCYLYGIYNVVNHSISLNKVMKYFHKKLHAVYWSAKCAKHINDSNIIDKKLTTQNGGDIFENSTYFGDLIKNDTIHYEYSILSNKGSITTMYKKLRDEFQKSDNNMDNIMKYIAEIDCYNAIAKLYHDLETQNKPVSFANYIYKTSHLDDDDEENEDKNVEYKPMLLIDNIHNICCENAICNNVTYDGDKNTVVITGPNGSGKSTYIKAIMESIIMAQTFGVAFASSMTLTPFTHLTTYLNIPDCQGKESLFQAEMSRCHKFLTELDEHDESNDNINERLDSSFSFNIVDEIFVSTNYKEGISAAGAVVNKLSKYNKCLNIVITHFDLKEICKDNVDYKYFTIEDNLECDYKIRDGVNGKHMALKLLKKKGFDSDLVNEANNIYDDLFIKKVDKRLREDEKDTDKEGKEGEDGKRY